MKKSTRNSLLLVFASLIWGCAFVAQDTGGDALGPCTFNFSRSVIGALFIGLMILVMDRMKWSVSSRNPELSSRDLWTGGILCGFFLFIATNLQQLGLYLGAAIGKAGFMTTTYIILVPLLGIFLKKKCHWNVWIGVCLTLVGLFFLCNITDLSLQPADTLLLLCALSFSFQILVIDHYAGRVDPVRMSCIQFTVCSILTMIPTFFMELPAAGGLAPWLEQFHTAPAILSVLYAGILSSGIAYTLQMVGQVDVNPAIASMLMSLESVFSVLAGWLILQQKLSLRELAGCALIFAAVLIAQLPMGTAAEKQ